MAYGRVCLQLEAVENGQARQRRHHDRLLSRIGRAAIGSLVQRSVTEKLLDYVEAPRPEPAADVCGRRLTREKVQYLGVVLCVSEESALLRFDVRVIFVSD